MSLNIDVSVEKDLPRYGPNNGVYLFQQGGLSVSELGM